MTKTYRYALLVGVAVLFFLAISQFFILKSVFDAHRISDLMSMVNCIESRISGHMELLRQLPHAPPHTHSLAWLVDELQGYPFLKGVLVAEGRRIFINTMPYIPRDKVREIRQKCFTGYRIGDTYYFCTEFYPVPGRTLFMVLALDRSYELQAMKRSLVLTGATLAAALGLFLFSWYFISRAVRRQKELERQLESSERLALVGKLAAMVAHEIRNPLNTISMGLQFMKELGEVRLDIIDTMEREVTRLSELSLDLLSPDREMELSLNKIAVQELLCELEHRFAPKARQRSLSFTVTYPDDEIILSADRKWLVRALENLLRNAMEATPEGGAVELSVSQNDSSQINFVVKDTGTGIPDEIRSRLFEPFVSTKRDGFGLGLHLVKRVVEAHGWQVKIKDNPSGGTQVKITVGAGSDR